MGECPWDGGAAWRPGELKLATTHKDQYRDARVARAYSQFVGDERYNAPNGAENFLRQAVRSGHYPTRRDSAQGAMLTGGWSEFQTVRQDQLMSQSLQSLRRNRSSPCITTSATEQPSGRRHGASAGSQELHRVQTE